MKTNTLYLLIIVLFPFLAFGNNEGTGKIKQTPQGNNWMSFLGDNRPLNFISIPGTHDAGALYNEEILGIVVSYAKTQDYSIADQLAFGVRYLDIRCNYTEGEFKIYHGSTDQKQNFDDVLKTCKTFLSNNPSETIIMSLKQEKSNIVNNTYSQRFYEYAQSYPNLFYLENEMPKLGSVRGKIVLLRRFISYDNIGINMYSSKYWPDNSILEVTNSHNINLYIQDVYKVISNETKLYQIKQTTESSIKESRLNRDSRKFYFNFTSGQLQNSSGNKIKNVSNYINPKIYNYYGEAKNQNSYLGLVITDFIWADLSRRIYMTNFPDNNY